MCARVAKICRRRATPPPLPPRRTPAGTGWWSCSEGWARPPRRAPRRSASRPAPPTCPGSRSAASRAARRAACCRGCRAAWSAVSRAETRAATIAASAAGWPPPRTPALAGAVSTTPSRRAWSCRPGCGCPSCYWVSRAKTALLAGIEAERAEGRAAATADDIGRPWLMREPEIRTWSPRCKLTSFK